MDIHIEYYGYYPNLWARPTSPDLKAEAATRNGDELLTFQAYKMR